MNLGTVTGRFSPRREIRPEGGGTRERLSVFFSRTLLMAVLLAGTGMLLKAQLLLPRNLSVELLSEPEKTVIRDLCPEFGWEVRSLEPGVIQSNCQLQVVSPGPGERPGRAGIIWDSGKVECRESINFPYGGGELSPGRHYAWRAKVWDQEGRESGWSEFQHFYTAKRPGLDRVSVYPLETRLVRPVSFRKEGDRHFYDFGKAAFGTVRIVLPPMERVRTVRVRLAEKLSGEYRLDSRPPGSVRYREISLEVGPGVRMVEASIPPDPRNTKPGAILMPDCIGEVFPFRYCEVVSPGVLLESGSVEMKAVNYPFNDHASDFFCSNSRLNDIWELCKYSIKATSFAGIYVDGDRERIPYEADAYINQLGHYCTDREYSMARATHEYLIKHPTWPTEWILHSVLMAWEDYLYTGNLESAEACFGDLKHKTLFALEDSNGLISTAAGKVSQEVLDSIHLNAEMRDIVDWPPGSFTEGGIGERDGHEMVEFNTVVNAFYYRALCLFSKLAQALGEDRTASEFADRATRLKAVFNDLLLDPAKGCYRDGIGTDHSSLHSNMFPLAFEMVPDEFQNRVVEFVKSRGMACSVYGAQYLLDGLYRAGEDQAALGLMTSEGDRGWLNMLRTGSTITLEAWDHKYKNNLDWNHAWGAAPANIIPRWILGVRPLTPGSGLIVISPRPGGLEWAKGKVPTIRGSVRVEFMQKDGEFILEAEVPGNTRARIELPRGSGTFLNGEEVERPKAQGTEVLIVDSGCHRVRILEPVLR